MKYMIIFLIASSILAKDPKPNQQTYAENPTVEITNQHLQENYFLQISKNLILTGEIVKDHDKLIDKRAYTNLKIEF